MLIVGAMTPTPVHSTTTEGSSFSRSAVLYGESARSRYSVGTISSGVTSSCASTKSLTTALRRVGLGGAGRAASRAELLLVRRAVPRRVADVVQRYGERAHADRVQRLELGDQGPDVGGRGVADRQAGREGVGEADVVGGGAVDQLLQGRQLGGRVVVAPVRAQIRVVLGGVDVHVLLRAAVEVELGEAVALGPGGAVEALDHSAQGGRRPVPDCGGGDRAVGDELAEGLGRVVRACRVHAGQGDGALARGQRVAAGGESGGGLRRCRCLSAFAVAGFSVGPPT